MSGWLALAALILSVAGLVVAVLSWREAERSAAASEQSAESSQQSAKAAKRANELAEKALALQQRESEATGEERARSRTADLIPRSWESSNRGPYRGLVVKNEGRGVAKDVPALRHHGGPLQASFVTAISPGETSGLLLDDRQNPPNSEETQSVPPHEPRTVATKLSWTNDDGSLGETDWFIVPIH